MTIGLALESFGIIHNRTTVIILFIGSAVSIVMVGIMNIITSVLLQKMIPNNFLSRMVSIINLLATISIPIGQMIYGVMVDLIPVFWTLILSTIGNSMLYLLSKSILKEVPQIEELRVEHTVSSVDEEKR